MGAAPPEADWPKGYEIGETILAFGTTVTLRARRGERRVIVKMARPGIRDLGRTSSALEREARILAELDHPALPALVEVVRAPPRVALVFVDHGGHRLDVVLDRLGRLPFEAAIAVGIEVAGALAAIHRGGHAHGLLRPQLVELGESGHVYLHATGQSPRGAERGHDELLELPRHMAPEMILGDEADPAADVFLVGLVLFQCLTGGHPFSGDEAGITQRIRHSPTPPLRRQVPEAPAEVDRILRRCLEKRPRDRFADLSLVQAMLVKILRDRTPLPRELIVARALASAGLADDPPPPRERHLRRAAIFDNPSLRRWAVIGGAAALIGGATVFGLTANGEGVSPGADARGIVGRPARLRVLAHPWAEIYVDGELVDVTPLARLLEVTPGRHEIVFRHPQAADERRVIEIIPGQTILLDVEMQVVRSEDAGPPQADGSAEDESP